MRKLCCWLKETLLNSCGLKKVLLINFMRELFQPGNHFAKLIVALLFGFAITINGSAQSTDPALPTAVVSNEINGRISPRDTGDARLTRHFYIFTGTPGDLVITVESQSLDGDVDLFTFGNMRPLAKLTLYAGATSASATKNIFLRKQEALLLRIEARSTNDAEGSYRIRFDGAFALASSDTAGQSESNRLPAPVINFGERNTRRVTSVGGKVEADERVEAVEAETSGNVKATRESAATVRAPNPVVSSEPSPPVAPTVTPKPVVVKAARTKPPRPSRTSRVRSEPVPKNRTPPVPKPNSPPAAPPPIISARLIIETRDGTRLEREMNTVRRITVENNQLVIVTKDGRFERQSMTNVLRMSIEP